MTKRIRLLLADHLKLVREGLNALLSNIADIEVVGEAETADNAVSLARQLQPDLVLMDQDMPGDSLLATRLIREGMPNIEIIIMTDRLSNGRASQAIEAGATGFVVKDIPIASLASAIRAVSNGRAFFHPQINRILLERLGRSSRDQRGRLQRDLERLTPRELDILGELARGNTDREIAAKFVLAEGTVKTHIRHILKKLGARNRTQAVAHVLRKGIID
jgi:DNA-binding NarL/FixJ family response regulator